MQKDNLSFSRHKKHLLLLLAGTVLILMTAVAFTITALTEKKAALMSSAADTCREELALFNDRLAEWKDSTQAVISSISQENLFRVFITDYASSKSGLDRLDALKNDINAPEYEFFQYIQDVLNDVARMHGIRNAALLLPDGRPFLGETSGVEKNALTGTSNFRIFSCTEENGNVYARTATAVFPLNSEEKPNAYLILDVPLDAGFDKVLSSTTHHEIQYSLLLPAGKLSLSGGKVLFTPETLPAGGFDEGSFLEEHGQEFCMYTAVHDPAEGFMRASISKDILEGREAKAKWDVLIFAITVMTAIILLALVLYFAETAANETKLNRRISQQSFLLQSINSSVENGIVLMDRRGMVLYKNKYFPGEEWERTPLDSIFPAGAAATIISKTGEVTEALKPATIETFIEENGEKRLFRVALFPYVPERGKSADALSVIQFTDITIFRKRAIEQKRRMENLLDVFACAMESVDKGFRGQTRKMLAVIDLIRIPLGLSSDEVQTLSIAARLQGISKLFIPHDLVVKQGKLTDEEKARIAQANTIAGHMVQNFDFRLPVSTTLDQSGERIDGTGRPNGLKGDEILATAKILAVVTSFCAMTSPRAYRAAYTASEAIETLSSDRGYDQTIVAGLAHAGTETLEKLIAAENIERLNLA